ncbi:MAG: hypothetical protein PHG85_05720 [Candidatus Altiarchaeota archaeon]|nr:hypothetical protein [Candidatus Altiarchaeota archaeon]
MPKQRAQGAMEYLMTYGWAIIVVMAVGILLWRVGVFQFSGPEITSSGFNKVKPILSTCKMMSSGLFSCMFTNGAGSYIRINTVLMRGCTGAPEFPRGDIPSTEAFFINLTGCRGGKFPDPYTADIYIHYNLSVGGTNIERNESGEIRSAYEAGG